VPDPRPLKTFLGISSFEVLAMFRRGLFYAYLSVYLRHYLGLSVTETTLFATLPMLLNILFQTFCWGPLSDRLQRRRTLIVTGEVLAAFGTLAVWGVHRLPEDPRTIGYVIIAGLSLVEIFWSMSNVGWSALISDLYGAGDRTAVQGRLAAIGGMGRIAGVWVGGIFYDGAGRHYNGWGFEHGTLFFIAAAVMLLSVIPMLTVPEGGVGGAEQKNGSSGSGLAAASATRVFLIFLIAMVLINFGRNSIAVIVSQYLTAGSGLHVSSMELSHLFNTQSVAMILTGLGAGWMGRRLGDGASLLFGAGVGILALGIFAFSLDLGLIYLAQFMRGFADVIIMAASYTFASVLMPPVRRARLFALFNATFFLSWGLAGTLMAGPLADLLMKSGSTEVFAYQMAFAAAALMSLSGVILLAFLLYGILPRARGSSR
jgi:MFS family permease